MVSPYYGPADARRCSDRTVAHYSPYCMDNRTTSYAEHSSPKPVPVNAGGDRGEPVGARKRISVACTRCRKRKIRCSGDNGTGDSCDGCKASGNEPCLFLRVSSTEVPAKSDGFHYNLDTSRRFQARGSFYPAATAGQPMPLVSTPIPSYAQAFGVYCDQDSLPSRNSAPSPYASQRTYYPAISGYHTVDGQDAQHVECRTYAAPPTVPSYHSPMSQEHASIPGYRPVPMRESSCTSLYLDTDHAYGYIGRPPVHGISSVVGGDTNVVNLPGGIPVLGSSVPSQGHAVGDQQSLESPAICESVSPDTIEASRSSPVEISPSAPTSAMTSRSSSSLASSPDTSAYSTPYSNHEELYTLGSSGSSSRMYTFSGSMDRLETPPAVTGTIAGYSYGSPAYRPDRTFECRDGPGGTVVIPKGTADGHYKAITSLRT